MEPGTENFPANGISFEQAKAYCTWLAKMTGQPFRLGTVDEMEPIHDSAENQENTLDFWAGYALNPEDAAPNLETTIKNLGGKAAICSRKSAASAARTPRSASLTWAATLRNGPTMAARARCLAASG